MVRIKHRYLLLDILYPDPSTWPSQPKRVKPTSLRRISGDGDGKEEKEDEEEEQAQLRIHAPTSDALTPGLLAKMVREEVSEMFGDYGVGRLGGAGAAGVSVKYLSPATSTAIIRCPRASFRLVWSALTYMSHVPEYSSGSKRAGPSTRPCVFRVVKVSGTMRKAEEEAIRRARREIVRLRGVEEMGVLDGLGLGSRVSKGGAGAGAVVESVMDDDVDADEDMDGSDDE